MELPSWVDPTEQKPAPGPLLLVQAFVNSIDLELGTDELGDLPTAAAWLRATGLLGPTAKLRAADLELARQVREGLRALIAYNGGGPAPIDADLRGLRTVGATAHPQLTVAADGRLQLEPRTPGWLQDGLLHLLLSARDAQDDGTWQRLKLCRNPECGWAFYDRSHARAGAWCRMAGCGNVMKNRDLRARRSGRTADASTTR